MLTVQAAYAKNGQSRTIILNSRALECLKTLKASRRGEFVVCKPHGQPYKEMEKPFTQACQIRSLGDGPVYQWFNDTPTSVPVIRSRR